MAGGGGGDTETTQKTEPWDPQQAYLRDIFEQAAMQYQAPGPEYYPGSQVVPYSPQEQVAQTMVEDYALTGAPSQVADAQNAQQFLIGDVLRPDSNPYLQQAAAGAIQPVREELMNNILPAIDDGAVIAGAYGSDRQGIAQSQAIDLAIQDMLNTTSSMYNTGYQNNLDAYVKGLALSPQTMQMGLAPAGYLSATGEMDRALAQQLLNQDVAAWDFSQQLPAAKLADYQGFVQGTYGGTGTGTSAGGSSSDLLGALGGAMGGYALASTATGTAALGSLMVPASMAGPVGAGLGALAYLALS